jgi:hypothetical protein
VVPLIKGVGEGALRVLEENVVDLVIRGWNNTKLRIVRNLEISNLCWRRPGMIVIFAVDEKSHPLKRLIFINVVQVDCVGLLSPSDREDGSILWEIAGLYFGGSYSL